MKAQLWRPPRSISQSSCRHVGRKARGATAWDPSLNFRFEGSQIGNSPRGVSVTVGVGIGISVGIDVGVEGSSSVFHSYYLSDELFSAQQSLWCGWVRREVVRALRRDRQRSSGMTFPQSKPSASKSCVLDLRSKRTGSSKQSADGSARLLEAAGYVPIRSGRVASGNLFSTGMIYGPRTHEMKGCLVALYIRVSPRLRLIGAGAWASARLQANCMSELVIDCRPASIVKQLC